MDIDKDITVDEAQDIVDWLVEKFHIIARCKHTQGLHDVQYLSVMRKLRTTKKDKK